jgi:hypothetical protein
MADAREGDAGATRHDDDVDLIGYVKARVADEHGLSEADGRRLVGSTLKALRQDAKRMRVELGLDDAEGDGDDDVRRDERGRFMKAGKAVSMNEAIRAAAGR